MAISSQASRAYIRSLFARDPCESCLQAFAPESTTCSDPGAPIIVSSSPTAKPSCTCDLDRDACVTAAWLHLQASRHRIISPPTSVRQVNTRVGLGNSGHSQLSGRDQSMTVATLVRNEEIAFARHLLNQAGLANSRDPEHDYISRVQNIRPKDHAVPFPDQLRSVADQIMASIPRKLVGDHTSSLSVDRNRVPPNRFTPIERACINAHVRGATKHNASSPMTAAGSQAETAEAMNDPINFWPITSQFGGTPAQITHDWETGTGILYTGT